MKTPAPSVKENADGVNVKLFRLSPRGLTVVKKPVTASSAQTGVYVPLQNEGATGLYGWPVYAYVESAVAVGTNPIARIEKASAAANKWRG